MPSRYCEFVDSRLRRCPPDRASAVPYGQAGENATRFPHLAHRSAAVHKLHSTRQQRTINSISGNDETSRRVPAFSLFLPGSCPNNRDHRSVYAEHTFAAVAEGYSVLQGNGQYGPYALVLQTTPYADTYAPLPDTLILTADRIKPLMTAGFFGTGTLPSN